MKESSEEPESGSSAAASPFGEGVPRPVRLGAKAVPAVGDSGRRSGDSPLGAGEVPAPHPRKPTTFRCALGRSWPRSTAQDFQRLLPRAPEAGGAGGDALEDAELERAVLPLGRLRAAVGDLAVEGLDEILETFEEEGRRAAAEAHFAPPVAMTSRTAEALGTLGPEVGSILLRPHVAEPFSDFSTRLVHLLAMGRPVFVLSDPTLPVLAQSAVDWILGVEPDAPLYLLHDDGLDVLRFAASQPHVALELVEPEVGLAAAVVSLRRIRAELEKVHAVEAAEAAAVECNEQEGDGWFGSGVVAAPLAPMTIRTCLPETFEVDPGTEPEEAAAEIVARAFGPEVLGGYSVHALSRVRIPATMFSLVTEQVRQQLGALKDDPRSDPPFWVLDAPEPSAVLPRAKRLGLDEGATLIVERTEARDDGKTYGMVFTNGEERMRTGGAARALGILVLMRGVSVM